MTAAPSFFERHRMALRPQPHDRPIGAPPPQRPGRRVVFLLAGREARMIFEEHLRLAPRTVPFLRLWDGRNQVRAAARLKYTIGGLPVSIASVTWPMRPVTWNSGASPRITSSLVKPIHAS